MTQTSKRGFTLIELLIVIAIVAVLAVAVVLVLNPAELLKQGRGAQRISDLGAISSAIALYVADVTPPTWVAAFNCTTGTVGPGLGACLLNAGRAVVGTGWVNVALNSISGGSPLAQLPLDPVNSSGCTGGSTTSTNCLYAYKSTATAGKWKIAANMESIKYSTGGSGDVETNTKDGGTDGYWYESGSDLGIVW